MRGRRTVLVLVVGAVVPRTVVTLVPDGLRATGAAVVVGAGARVPTVVTLVPDGLRATGWADVVEVGAGARVPTVVTLVPDGLRATGWIGVDVPMEGVVVGFGVTTALGTAVGVPATGIVARAGEGLTVDGSIPPVDGAGAVTRSMIDSGDSPCGSYW